MNNNAKDEKDASENINTLCLGDIKPKQLKWLIHPYLPQGKIVMLIGDPGLGKTTFALNIVASLSNGKKLDNTELPIGPLNILYQTGEDDLSDTLVPRLIAAGANMKRIFSINEEKSPLTMDDHRLEEAIIQHKVKLVVMDPMQAFLGKIDMNKANEVREKTKFLTYLGERTGCTFLLLGHLNKSLAGKVAYRSLGSIDFYAIARSVMLIGCDPCNPDIRIVFHIKTNIAQKAYPIAFTIIEDKDSASGQFQYIGPYDITIEDALYGNPKKLRKSEIAKQLIFRKLFDHDVPAASMYEYAKKRGISIRTLEEAKRELGVKTHKAGKQWIWEKVSEERMNNE